MRYALGLRAATPIGHKISPAVSKISAPIFWPCLAVEQLGFGLFQFSSTEHLKPRFGIHYKTNCCPTELRLLWLKNCKLGYSCKQLSSELFTSLLQFFFHQDSRFVQLYHAQSWKKILFASVYVLSFNGYKQSDREMRQYKITADVVGARYRRKVQQYLLILIYKYGTRFIR